MKKYSYVIVIFLLLIGCESNIETKVNLSDLQSKKIINGDLYFEVGMCGDMEDSRKPSSFVVEAQKQCHIFFRVPNM